MDTKIPYIPDVLASEKDKWSNRKLNKKARKKAKLLYLDAKDVMLR